MKNGKFISDPKPEPKAKKKPKGINKVSKRRATEQKIYEVRSKLFLMLNKICFIRGCGKTATTIEHTAGRIGKNFLDESTWEPCCWAHNTELENNPALSNEYQVSKISGGKKIKSLK